MLSIQSLSSLRISSGAQNMVLVGKVKVMAEAKGVTAGQLALAWVHAQGDDVFPIPGVPLLMPTSAACSRCMRDGRSDAVQTVLKLAGIVKHNHAAAGPRLCHSCCATAHSL